MHKIVKYTQKALFFSPKKELTHFLELARKIAKAAATCAIERSFEAGDFLSHVVCDRHFEAAKRATALASATIALFSREEHLLAHAVQNL